MKDARERLRSAEEKRETAVKTLRETEEEISRLSLQLRPEEREKYAPSSSSSSSKALKSDVAKLEKTLAGLTAKKNELSFDPLKVTRFEDLNKEKNSLLKEKTEVLKRREKLNELLEVGCNEE